MKKVALISSFCDNKEKIDVLDKNIRTIKSFDIDIILISPIHLPKEITSLCDYYFQTKDNPVLDWPERSMFIWMDLNINGEMYRISRTYADYGWAGLFQVKQLSQFALNLDYDQFFHMIYDLRIDSNVIRGLLSDKKCNIYPSRRGKDVWKVGLHFMIFDRKNLERFISNIHLDSYLSLKGSDAFDWLYNLNSVFPYSFESEPVEDEIYYYEGHDFYNYSPSDKFSMFIVKDDEVEDNVKLVFYNVLDPKLGKIKVNSSFIEFNMGEYEILDLGIKQFDVQEVEIYWEGESYNITRTIHQIKHNTLRKNE